MPYTYILHSQQIDKYYIGSTSASLEERLKKHLTNHSGFTGKVKDWKVVYFEHYDDLTLARKRELAIKKWKSKKRIQKLIENFQG